MKSQTLTEVNVERAARRPVIVVTDTASGEQRLVKARDIASDPLGAELSKQLRMGKSGMIEAGGKKLFLNVYAPTARLVINDDGTFLGSVSGGCVEGAVVTEALDVIASGKPKLLEFGVADETAWNVGLSCGGTIRVFVEKVGQS